MPNLGFKPGYRVSMRLVHCFEMRGGRIAHEMTREYQAPATSTASPPAPHYGEW